MDERDDSPGLSLGLDPVSQKGTGAYRVLARKYRPQTFDSLVGQDAMVRTLANAFTSGRIAHAFMLTGVRGVGKTTTARIIARALNCIGADGKRTEPTIDPCGVCEMCVSIAESRQVDVLEMDAASRTGVDDIREIIDGVRYLPQSARTKVYIIDEVHMLSRNAFNALLKTLEEPPPHAKFIFATTEIRKVPVTVLSRCQRFDLKRIPAETLSGLLRKTAEGEGAKISDDALALIARAAEGSARDGQSLLDQAIALGEPGETVGAETVRRMLGLADRTRTLELFRLVMKGEIGPALAELRGQYDSGADPVAVLTDLLELTHWLTRLKVAPEAAKSTDRSAPETDAATAMAAGLSMAALTRAWTLLLRGLQETRDAPLAIQAAEMALVRLAHAADLPPLDRIVETLENAPAGSLPPSGPRPSGGGAVRAEARAAVKSAPAPEAAPQARADPLPDFEAVIARLDAEGDLILKEKIERHVRLVSFAPKQIAIAVDDGAQARAIIAGLQERLKRWTASNWFITLGEGGGKTRREVQAEAEAAKRQAAMALPLVKAALEIFDGARIAAVRGPETLTQAEAGDGETPETQEDET
jgi:DNA polymerase-3 subunit gamma/tau